MKEIIKKFVSIARRKLLPSSPRQIKSLFVVATIIVILSVSAPKGVEASGVAERELARKLIKLFLAAAVLAPPGLGAFPIPFPLPVPFGIETLKPPIYAPFGFPFVHGLGGSDLLAFPVLKPTSAAASAPGVKKIAVTAAKAAAMSSNLIPGSSSMASSVVPIRVIGPSIGSQPIQFRPQQFHQPYQYPPPIPYLAQFPQPRVPIMSIYPPVAPMSVNNNQVQQQQRATNPPPTKTPQIVIPNLQNHRLF